MAKRWIVAALVTWALTQASYVSAQDGGPQMVPGPLTGPLAPEISVAATSLPANLPNAFDGSDNPPPGDAAWFSGDWLLWWFDNPRLKFPLVTSSVLPAGTGVIGDPNTVVLLQGLQQYKSVNGARLTFGLWFNSDRNLGIEASGFGFENVIRHYSIASTPAGGGPPLFIPSRDATTGAENALEVTPLGTVGGIAFAYSTRLWSGAADFVVADTGYPVQLLVGFRNAHMEETLKLRASTLQVGPGLQPIDTYFQFDDHFSTRNEFNGGELGVRYQYDYAQFWIRATAKVALGNNHQAVSVRGTGITAFPGVPAVTTPTGIFAQPSNTGTVTHDTFSYISEGDVKLGIRMSETWSLNFGYSFLYWDRVVRATDQIDRTLPPLLPGPMNGSRPFRLFNETSFWAHGLSAGLEITY